jgi:hypothetical protein
MADNALNGGGIVGDTQKQPVPAERRQRRRWKGIASWVLLVLACLLAIVSVVTVFARNQLLNTDDYVRTVAPLASNSAIQTQVAKQVSANLVRRANLEERVKAALPPKAGIVAAPIAAGFESLTNEVALKAVRSKQFERLWVSVNRVSHKQLVALLTGSSNGSVSSKNGKVTINLSQVELQVKKDLDAKGITVFDKVPAVKGLNFVLFQSKSLTKVQRLTKLLNDLAIVLPIATLVCFAGAVVLTRPRRRGVVRATTALAFSMTLILVFLALARNHYLSGLSPSQSVAANAAVIGTVTAALRRGIRIILIASLVLAVIAMIVGNDRVRTRLAKREMPRWMTDGPFHGFVVRHRRGLQWLVLALGVLVLVIWSSPTTLVAIIVVLSTLALMGVIGLFAGHQPLTPAVNAAARPSPPEPEKGSTRK